VSRPDPDYRGPLATEMRAFVDAKRALGRRFLTEEKQLRLLDAFLAHKRIRSAEDVSPATMDAFLASRARARARSHNELLGVARRFFDWLVQQGRLSRSPVRSRRRRATGQRLPFLFGPDEVVRLLKLTEEMADRPRAPLRGPTYTLIFALLYGLGLRVGEVSRLRRRDVDLDRQLLVIRDTKFGKSRLVPFGPRIGKRIQAYLRLRGDLHPDAAIFSFTRRGTVHPGTISQTFRQLLPKLALVIPPGVTSPRVHDLRHAFAVGTLLRWYREGIDPSARLFHLSTFLGHVNPSSTAVYLNITTELLVSANQRFEAFAASTVKAVAR